MTEQQQIKMVVLNEHTLGYIIPELPNYVQVLHSSILKGSPYGLFPDSIIIGSMDTVRMAEEKDFDEFNVLYDQYAKHPDLYEFKS